MGIYGFLELDREKQFFYEYLELDNELNKYDLRWNFVVSFGYTNICMYDYPSLELNQDIMNMLCLYGTDDSKELARILKDAYIDHYIWSMTIGDCVNLNEFNCSIEDEGCDAYIYSKENFLDELGCDHIHEWEVTEKHYEMLNFSNEYKKNFKPNDGFKKFKLKKYLDSCSNKYYIAKIEKPIAKKSGYVYIIRSDYGYKIGMTKHIKDRLQLFGVKLPFEIEQVKIYKGETYTELEKELHLLYDHNRLNGEWFKLSDSDLIKIDKLMIKNDFEIIEENII